MTDYTELMQILSVPRPNGSRAERQTCQALTSWLDRQGVPHRLQSFRIYPYFFEAIGVFLIVSRTLLALAVALRWGWPSLLIALISLPGGLLDVALGIPLVTWPGARQGNNILIQFDPPNRARAKNGYPPAVRQEILLTAHYDSKTEVFDHHQRMFFLLQIPLGIVLTVLVGIMGLADGLLLEQNSPANRLSHFFGVGLSLPMLFLAWGLGLNLCLGRLLSPSRGAVDNGAACAILLGLAQRLKHGDLALENSRLTLALFTGEEVNMQGSRAYVSRRDWPLPAWALNLEVMAQDGEYVFWERDGSSLKLVPCSSQLNAILAAAVEDVTGQPPRPAGPINSDGYSFLRKGIPATVLGTYHTTWVDRGFHLPSDNLERVVMDRLPEGVEILARFMQLLDQDAHPTERTE